MVEHFGLNIGKKKKMPNEEILDYNSVAVNCIDCGKQFWVTKDDFFGPLPTKRCYMCNIVFKKTLIKQYSNNDVSTSG